MRPARPTCRPSARRALRAAVLALAFAVLAPQLALADEYESDRAGHPLRIVAYIVHPVGVAIDYLIMRPAHWLGSHEPLRTIFGHEEED